MKKLKFKTPYNYDYKVVKYASNSGVSKTQPAAALSIREIIERYRRGVPLPGRNPSYSDEFVPDIAAMDFVDRDALREEAAEHIERLRKEVTSQKQKREAQAANERKGQLSDSEGDVASSSESDEKRSVAERKGASEQSDRRADIGQKH